MSTIKEMSEGRTDMFRIDPRKLNVKPSWNGRDFNDPANIEHVNILALSIAEIGVKEPLTVYMEDGKAWLSDGECRLRATLQAIKAGAEIKTIPVKTEDRYANEADKLFSQIIRNTGKPFSQMEQAKVYKRLLDLGWAQGDIAKKAGISAARVSQILNLLTLPEPIKAMVSSGQVSANMAVAAIKDHNPAKAIAVLQDAVATAQSEGATKAMPRHVAPAVAPMGAPATPNEPKEPSNLVRGGIEKIVHNAFEFSDVDDSDTEIVVIKMPVEQWEAIRKACKL